MKSSSGSQIDILIDQGKDDEFLTNGQLLPDNFIAACTEKKIPVVYRLQEASIGKPLFDLHSKTFKKLDYVQRRFYFSYLRPEEDAGRRSL